MGLKASGAEAALKEGLLSSTRYLGAHTADPGTTRANELSGGNYAAAALAASATTLAGTVASNNTSVMFLDPTVAPGDHVWTSLNAAESGGDTLITKENSTDTAPPTVGADWGWAAGSLTFSAAVGSGGLIPAGGLSLCLKGGLLNGNRYASLHTGDPGTTRANEYSGGSYEAELIVLSNWTINSSGIASLNAIISYDVLTTDLPDAMWVALNTSKTGGTTVWARAFNNNPDDPEIGDTLSWPVGSLTIGLTTD